MQKTQIYLAGKMSGLSYDEMNKWREDFRHSLDSTAYYAGKSVFVVNPVKYFNFEEKRYQTEEEVMKFDIAKVRKSDLVVVNIDGLSESIGTCMELYEAYTKNIPVLAFGLTREDYDKLHPWIKVCITRYDDEVTELLDYIRDFYLR